MTIVEWMQPVVDLVSNVGFPIFISLYLLHRMENKIDDIVDVLQQLSTTLVNRH